jgi:hypothetical protein
VLELRIFLNPLKPFYNNNNNNNNNNEEEEKEKEEANLDLLKKI